MKALSLTIQKLWPNVKGFFSDGQTDKRTGKKNICPRSMDEGGIERINIGSSPLYSRLRACPCASPATNNVRVQLLDKRRYKPT